MVGGSLTSSARAGAVSESEVKTALESASIRRIMFPPRGFRSAKFGSCWLGPVIAASRRRASGPNPKFARSRGALVANFGFRTLAFLYLFLVRLRFRSSLDGFAAKLKRTSEPKPHQR